MLFFKPIIDVYSWTVCGTESLTRGDGKAIAFSESGTESLTVTFTLRGACFAEFGPLTVKDFYFDDDGTVVQNGSFVSQSICGFDGLVVAM